MKKFIVTSGIIVTLVLVSSVFALRMLFPLKYKSEIQRYAKEYNVDPSIIAAVIHFETEFKEVSYSPGKKVGPMNIKDEAGIKIALEMGEKITNREQVAEPDTNIKLGTWYISQKCRFDDLSIMMEKWVQRNGQARQEIIDTARNIYAKDIKFRRLLYRILYPSLKN